MLTAVSGQRRERRRTHHALSTPRPSALSARTPTQRGELLPQSAPEASPRPQGGPRGLPPPRGGAGGDVEGGEEPPQVLGALARPGF